MYAKISELLNMETFYVTKEAFWDWFNRTEDLEELDIQPLPNPNKSLQLKKRMKLSINDTEAADRNGTRYIIMYGRHKPGKKSKVWEADGYLTLVGRVAHVCDLNGRMLEEPTLLDEIDYKLVVELNELTIGNTEIQMVEEDKN